MKKLLSLVAGALLLAACHDGPVAPRAEAPGLTPVFGVTVDPALTDALGSASATDRLQVIAVFDEATTTGSAVASAIQGLGAGVIGFKHLPMVAALATPSQIDAMQGITGVTGVYFNAELEYHNLQGVHSINADDVHAMGITGKGIGVAILDSGIDGVHPDLLYPSKTVGNVKYVADLEEQFAGEGSPVLAATLFVDNVPNSETSIGHGTHVAGTAAGSGDASGGKYKGVAPGANLVGIGAGDILFIFWTLAGFDYILENQAKYNIKVVNNSWGSAGGAYDPNAPINVATKKVSGSGITVVFSAGNSGPAENTLNRWSLAPWVISVAAGCKLIEDDNTANWQSRCKDPNGRAPVLASFSSRGIPGDPMFHPDITAPGVYTVSTRASTGTVINALDALSDATRCAIDLTHQPYYTCASGTSMAAPHVAGTVALLQEAAGGTLTPDQVLKAITQTAKKLDGFAEWEVGAGYLDAKAAVDLVRHPSFTKKK